MKKLKTKHSKNSVIREHELNMQYAEAHSHVTDRELRVSHYEEIIAKMTSAQLRHWLSATENELIHLRECLKEKEDTLASALATSHKYQELQFNTQQELNRVRSTIKQLGGALQCL